MTLDTAQIKHYVQANLARIQSREDVAAAFGVSLERLRKAFHEAEGMTLTECIDEARIEEAKRLLRKTDYRSKEVCFAVGFARPDCGERTFKEATGLTMQAYRKRYRRR